MSAYQKFEFNGEEIAVFKNPSISELRSLESWKTDSDANAFVTKTDVYVWDGYTKFFHVHGPKFIKGFASDWIPVFLSKTSKGMIVSPAGNMKSFGTATTALIEGNDLLHKLFPGLHISA